MKKLTSCLLLIFVISCAPTVKVALTSMTDEQLLKAYYQYDDQIKSKERQALGYRSSGHSISAAMVEPTSSEREELINMRIELRRRGINP